MFSLKTQYHITMFLGALSFAAGVIAHLALTDIYHAETNLTLEWSVLQVCAVIIATFIISAMLLMRKLHKAL